MTQLDRPVAPSRPDPPLTVDERAELDRLRREVQALHVGPRPRTGFRWRSLVAVVLIVLGCVLAPVAGLAVWTNNQLSDTDRFVRSVGPLVDDPDVQSALTGRLTETVFTYVDVQTLADDAVDALEGVGVPPLLVDRLGTFTPTITSAVENFVRERIAQLVAGPAFEAVWDRAIATAHDRLDAVLSGDSDGVVVQDGAVYLQLGPFVDLVKERLSDAGLTAVSLIPDVNPTVELAQADTLVRAQTAYDTLNTVAGVLPWVVLLLFVAGIYLARNRLRALVGTGLGLALSMVVLAAGLLVARSLLVDAVPAAAAPAAGSGFDIVVTYLRYGLRALLVLGLVLALAGFLAGRSETAVGIRSWTKERLHSIRGGPSPDGRVGTWARRHVRGLRIAAVALAVLVFVFLTEPTGAAILVIAALLLVVLAVIEFLARPATAPADRVEASREAPPPGPAR
ncbi:hypothetical protein [Trujillonella endophytica]|uniref:Integral membrane protein n=1 Tax=Trujillonella endophytica TaxID=673521 RepID=A0A1H8QPS9_9ACTN|nr:hypothetical protein [Trujillella endophytica]SEO56056.1 hypothetical protein SAMN05660991_00722 [Trujillella endophytica]